MKNKVYILGAGCSAKYGQPVAKDVVPQLGQFGRSLGENATQLKEYVMETVELMAKHNITTIDDLTERLHTGAFDRYSSLSVAASQHREERIWRAKIAMSTLLLSKEAVARESGLDSYHRLLHELCPGPGNWQERLRRSNCSVLTFNYDRLFEIALLLRNGPDLNGKLYGPPYLNSGFGDIFNNEISFAGGFCFLKLHGCVGRIVDLEEIQPCYRQVCGEFQHGGSIEINDSNFRLGVEASKPRFRTHPLIVFPHEKQHVQSGKKHAIYDRYLTCVWQQAEKLIAEADEICVIGYSFHAMDRQSLIDLLSKASKCGQVVVQNIDGEANRICREMSLKHRELKFKWEPFEHAF